MRRKRKNCWNFLIFIAAFFSNSAQAITLIHTNDVLGDIEPCGCRHNPQGGMARKYNLLTRTRAKDPFVIQVDAGDLLFSTDQIPEMLQEQSELQARYLLESMDLTQHDVVVPGEKDFALGLSTFQKLIKKTKIHFLAANLKKKNGKNILDSHVILTGKDSQGKTVRVGVFGLVG